MRAIAPRTGHPEIMVAEGQEEYSTLCAAVSAVPELENAECLITRWTFTPAERAKVAAGEDLYISTVTFGAPLQSLAVQVGPAGLAPPENPGLEIA